MFCFVVSIECQVSLRAGFVTAAAKAAVVMGLGGLSIALFCGVVGEMGSDLFGDLTGSSCGEHWVWVLIPLVIGAAGIFVRFATRSPRKLSDIETTLKVKFCLSIFCFVNCQKKQHFFLLCDFGGEI